MNQPAAANAPGHAPNRLGNVVWVACCLLIVVVVVGFWLRVHDERTGAQLSAQISDHQRPVAPALPTHDITGDGAPGLPSWYRTAAGSATKSAAGAMPIVLNWWASWCGPCVDEAPILRRMSHDYRGRVAFVGLNAGDRDLESDARNFVKAHRLAFSVVRGSKVDGDRWGVQRYPETFVIGTDGRISAHVNGPVDDRELRALIDSELSRHRRAASGQT
ncbi:MAG: Peroxiredoxin [Thermoleophilia bacterium]|nr:Peroxiredoxin [Thermoleophilia bacterium]